MTNGGYYTRGGNFDSEVEHNRSLIPSIIAEELARLLSKDCPELALPLFNFLNNSMQASDYLMILKNTEKAENLFFIKFLEDLENNNFVNKIHKTNISIIKEIINYESNENSKRINHKQEVDANFIKKFKETDIDEAEKLKIGNISKKSRNIRDKAFVDYKGNRNKSHSEVIKVRNQENFSKDSSTLSRTGDKSRFVEFNMPLEMKMSAFLLGSKNQFNEDSCLYRYILREISNSSSFNEEKFTKILNKFFESLLKIRWNNYTNVFLAIKNFQNDLDLNPKNLKINLSADCAKILIHQHEIIIKNFLDFFMQHCDEEGVAILVEFSSRRGGNEIGTRMAIECGFEDTPVEDSTSSSSDSTDQYYSDYDQQHQSNLNFQNNFKTPLPTNLSPIVNSDSRRNQKSTMMESTLPPRTTQPDGDYQDTSANYFGDGEETKNYGIETTGIDRTNFMSEIRSANYDASASNFEETGN